MKIRLNEDYYSGCCEWCDFRKSGALGKAAGRTYCGPATDRCNFRTKTAVVINSTIAAGCANHAGVADNYGRTVSLAGAGWFCRTGPD